MFYKFNFNILVLFFPILIIPIHSFDIELTVLIPANQRECFHQELEAGKTVEIEYEVLAGGDVDINYWFYSPTNRVLKSDLKKRDSHQTLKLEETGEYRFCFDNGISHFHQKQVYFSLRLINEQGHNERDRVTHSWMNDVARDDLGELQNKIQEIKDTFQRIWDNMEAAQRYQKVFNNYEVHDRVIAEANFERVNFWSVVHLFLMISVSVIQVVTIRSLFETKSAYGKILRGKK
jgi:protein ERP2